MFALLGFLILGGLLGSLVSLIFTAVAGRAAALDYGMLLSYPIMFLPAMFYVAAQSRNRSIESAGFALDSSNFAPQKEWICKLLVVVGTFAMAFCCDALTKVLPPMPEYLQEVLKGLTTGKFWVNFLLVSIMAPFFEEWLCRGMVLRGLLNNGKMHPVWAILISALFFALIHANPWQALPAFALGCLFGYVYYKTGSLWLTMIMHFTNNTLALVVSRIWPDAESWIDVMCVNRYWLFFALALVVLGLVIVAFSKVKTRSPKGNCDPVPALFTE